MNKKLLFSKPIQIIIAIIYLAVLGYVFVPHFLHTSQTGKVPQDKIVKCEHVGKTFLVNIDDQKFRPEKSELKVCDKIVFKNAGTKYHQPAFGDHPIHLIYPGFNEKALKAGESNELVMSAFGEFKIHDHIYEEIEGSITVEPPGR